MRLHLSFTADQSASTDSHDLGLALPIAVQRHRATIELRTPSEFHLPFTLVVHGSMPIDPMGLTVVEHLFNSGPEPNSPRLRALDCPETSVLTTYATDVISALAFLTKTPLRPCFAFGYEPGNFVEAETVADEDLLEHLGTDVARTGIVSTRWGETFFDPVIDARLLGAVASRIGVRLFAEAMHAGTHSGRFRDLWKVLESAFGTRSTELIRLLADYGPAQELGFTYDELQELRTLRGRASHAASRAGSAELSRVNAEVSHRLHRLEALAERVVLTKQAWNSSDLSADALLPLAFYIDASGIGHGDDPLAPV